MKTLALFLLLSASAWQLSTGLWIHAKAQLAQVLISSAWQQSLTDGKPHKPWAWADTWPVAQLQAADQQLYVLAGAQGNSLAFGPGHMHGTSLPGAAGTSIIAGHRDTHFAFLQHSKVGDLMSIKSPTGETSYQVTELKIVDSSTSDLSVHPQQEQLILITCYPFNQLQSGPLRYLVVAKPV